MSKELFSVDNGVWGSDFIYSASLPVGKKFYKYTKANLTKLKKQVSNLTGVPVSELRLVKRGNQGSELVTIAEENRRVAVEKARKDLAEQQALRNLNIDKLFNPLTGKTWKKTTANKTKLKKLLQTTVKLAVDKRNMENTKKIIEMGSKYEWINNNRFKTITLRVDVLTQFSDYERWFYDEIPFRLYTETPESFIDNLRPNTIMYNRNEFVEGAIGIASRFDRKLYRSVYQYMSINHNGYENNITSFFFPQLARDDFIEGYEDIGGNIQFPIGGVTNAVLSQYNLFGKRIMEECVMIDTNMSNEEIIEIHERQKSNNKRRNVSEVDLDIKLSEVNFYSQSVASNGKDALRLTRIPPRIMSINFDYNDEYQKASEEGKCVTYILSRIKISFDISGISVMQLSDFLKVKNTKLIVYNMFFDKIYESKIDNETNKQTVTMVMHDDHAYIIKKDVNKKLSHGNQGLINNVTGNSDKIVHNKKKKCTGESTHAQALNGASAGSSDIIVSECVDSQPEAASGVVGKDIVVSYKKQEISIPSDELINKIIESFKEYKEKENIQTQESGNEKIQYLLPKYDGNVVVNWDSIPKEYFVGFINNVVKRILGVFNCSPYIHKMVCENIVHISYTFLNGNEIVIKYKNSDILREYQKDVFENIPKSNFTKYQIDILKKYNTITCSRCISENYNNDIEASDVDIDMKSSHLNSLLSLKYDYPVYEAIDKVTIFNPDIDNTKESGFYFIDLSDAKHPNKNDGELQVVSPVYFPLKCIKTRVSTDLCNYLLENNIININDIKYKFLPSKTIPIINIQNKVKEFINRMNNIKGLTEAMKKENIVNLMGNIGKIDNIYEFYAITSSLKDVNLHKPFSGYSSMKFGESRYIIRKRKVNMIFENTVPLYQMIRDNELVRLDIMRKEVGGELLGVDTDGIIVRNPVRVCSLPNGIVEYRQKQMSTKLIERFRSAKPYEPCSMLDISEYKNIESLKTPEREKLFGFGCKYDFETSPCILKSYLTKDIYDSNDIEELKNKLLSGESAVITGLGGSGKTYIAKEVIEKRKLADPEYKAYFLAATNVAAKNLDYGAKTFHKAFNFSIDGKRDCTIGAEIKDADTIVIDEYFLSQPMFYGPIYALKDKGKQIIFLGDENQLEPVACKSKGCFNNIVTVDKIIDLADYNHYNLCKTKRYSDDDAIQIKKIVIEAERGNLSSLPLLTEKRDSPADREYFRAICYYNDTRKIINHESCVDYCKKYPDLKNIEIITSKESQRDINHVQPEKTIVAIGMPVTCFVSNKKLNLLNGMDYVVSDIITNQAPTESDTLCESKKNSHSVQLSGKNNEGKDIMISLSTNDFIKYMVISFATTVYKSQGKTFDFKYFIADIYTIQRINNGIYVAITRTRNLKDVRISHRRYFEFEKFVCDNIKK